MLGIRTRFIALLALAILGGAAPCCALPEFDVTTVPDAAPKKVKPAKRSADDVYVDLDLSSAREVVPAALAFEAEKYSAKPTVTVSEGENLRTVSKNCMLTAAEYFAARQLMKDGTQKLALRDNGTAVGGTVSLDRYTVEHCRNIYVPRKLVMKQELTEFSIPGELHVAGTYDIAGPNDSVKAKRVKLYPGGAIISSAPTVEKVTLRADKIESNLLSDSSRGGAASALPTAGSEYELKKIETELVKAEDEFIPSEGTEASVEIGVFHQARESCQPRQ